MEPKTPRQRIRLGRNVSGYTTIHGNVYKRNDDDGWYYLVDTVEAFTPEPFIVNAAKCNHEWFCDYQSMFNPSLDKYSCRKCGQKKEELC